MQAPRAFYALIALGVSLALLVSFVSPHLAARKVKPDWAIVPGYDGPPLRWQLTPGTIMTPVLIAFDVPCSGYSACLEDVTVSHASVEFQVTLTGPGRGEEVVWQPYVAHAAVPFADFVAIAERSATVEVRQVRRGSPGASNPPYVRALELHRPE